MSITGSTALRVLNNLKNDVSMDEENKHWHLEESLLLSFLILVSFKDPEYLISSLFVNISIAIELCDRNFAFTKQMLWEIVDMYFLFAKMRDVGPKSVTRLHGNYPRLKIHCSVVNKIAAFFVIFALCSGSVRGEIWIVRISIGVLRVVVFRINLLNLHIAWFRLSANKLISLTLGYISSFVECVLKISELKLSCSLEMGFQAFETMAGRHLLYATISQYLSWRMCALPISQFSCTRQVNR